MKNIIDREQFGPWALVTGASSGIGREFAKQLAGEGFNLVIVARRQALLEELGKELQQRYGIEYLVIGADMEEEGSFEKITARTDHLDIGLVVSNAGTGAPGEFIKKRREELMKMIHTSVIAHLNLTHHFSRQFVQNRRGGIILVSAMGANHGLPFMANDAGTRAYIRSFGLGLHEELKREGVHLTVLIPSPTETPIVSKLGFQPEKMPLKPISVEQCVSETLVAFQKNQASIIPGRLYRMMNRIIPDSISRRMFGKMLAEGNGIEW